MPRKISTPSQRQKDLERFAEKQQSTLRELAEGLQRFGQNPQAAKLREQLNRFRESPQVAKLREQLNRFRESPQAQEIARLTGLAERLERQEKATEAKSQPKRQQSRPQTQRVEEVLRVLYPDRIPSKSVLSNPRMCAAVWGYFKERKEYSASRNTILRAAGRLKR